MSLVIRAPKVGQSVTEVEVVSWEVDAGVTVTAGQTVAVVSTDKTDVEVASPGDGVLGPHLVEAGDVIAVGTPMAQVGSGAPPSDHPPKDRPLASPKAKRLAAERGIDLSSVQPGRPDGVVHAGDLDRAADLDPAGDLAQTAATRWQGRLVAERSRLPAVRRTAARRLTQAWTAPHFVQFMDAEVGWARDAKTNMTALAVHALARALAEHPHLNVAVDGDELVRFGEVNIGVAVDTPKGLLVPVVRDADRRNLAEIAETIAELASRATSGSLQLDDLTGGSATVSNLGAWGIRAGTPVLNPPESVVMFLGAAEDRAVVVDGAVVVRTLATVAMGYDHRSVDGAAAATLTRAVCRILGGPDPTGVR